MFRFGGNMGKCFNNRNARFPFNNRGELDTGGKVTIPAYDHTSGTPFALPEGVPFKDIVPGDYKDKPYMKDVTDVNSLFKKLDGAQILIGKRPAGIPAEDAAEVDWSNFYKAVGRPDKSESYEFTQIKGADGKEVKRDAAIETKVKDIFHKHGLSAKQAKGIQGDYEAILTEVAKDLKAKDVQTDVDFDALAAKTFGKDTEIVLASSKKLLEDNMPEGFGDHFKNLSNEHLILMAGVLKNIQTKYIKEDVITSGAAAATASNVEDLRKEARTLMASEPYQKPFHVEHAKALADVKDIYEKIDKLIKKP